MAKRLTEKQKEEITNLFKAGKSINDLSNMFNCTQLTISINLKKKIGEKFFKDIISNKSSKKLLEKKQKNGSLITDNHLDNKNENLYSLNEKNKENINQEYFSNTAFVEITPLINDIDELPRKDLSSIPIKEISFPQIVYMVVDKKIELETKYLSDYPDWQFLSKEELNRKTIEIYDDLKIAKRFCNKEQKVIKVPNPDVFKITSHILLAKGISRIINADKLIAL